MKWMQQQSKYENMAYVALWGLLFAAPVLSLALRTASDSTLTFRWYEVFMVWQQLAVFLALFLLHNFVLAPLLVWHQQRALYFALTGCLVVAFAAYHFTSTPHQHHGPHPIEHDGHQPPEFADNGYMPPEFADDHHGQPSKAGSATHRHPSFKPDDGQFREGPPPLFGMHDILGSIMLLLMFGANLGIKGYFKSRTDRKKLLALEKENLEQQLEYLKYQINPHFFMNTLNNIHALVDIDPDKAKDTILELSKMMRFVLYEGDKNGVPLSREFDFIRNYITLMRLRYTDKVHITVDLPVEVPDRQLPPLMLITFIENAFKHGISYQHSSFIHVKVGIEGTKLRFQCRNSKAEKQPTTTPRQGGVGLQNVKQRLHLLFDNNFTLTIQDEPDIYNVELLIPLS